MTTEHFSIKYDGEAVRTHEMDVALLAPALMGLHKAYEEFVTINSKGELKASLKVQGSPKKGSIEIMMVVETIASFPHNLIAMLTSQPAQALLNLAGFWGVYELIKRFGKQKPTKVEELIDGRKKLYFDEQTIEVDKQVYHSYQNFQIRESIYQTVKPLESEGIDTFAVSTKQTRILQVEKSEVVQFLPPSVVGTLLIGEQITYLQIKSLSFNLNNKWKFTRGDESFSANIIDEEFIKKVQKREHVFADGDILKVRLQIEQYRENDKLKANYKIIEVLEHIKSLQQEPLDL